MVHISEKIFSLSLIASNCPSKGKEHWRNTFLIRRSYCANLPVAVPLAKRFVSTRKTAEAARVLAVLKVDVHLTSILCQSSANVSSLSLQSLFFSHDN